MEAISTLVIIGITCLVSFAAFGNKELLASMVFWPPAVTKKHDYSRFLTYGLVHGDGMHLLFNMLTLYFFGTLLERFINQQLGTYGFAFFYVLGLVVSILPSYLRHRDDETYFSLGASGSVTAVLFGFILLQPWSTLSLFFAIPMPAIVFAVLYLGYTIYMERRKSDRVNHSAHLWGAVYGIAFMLCMQPSILGHFLRELSHPHFGR